MDDVIKQILDPARQYLFNAFMAGTEKQRDYWCARFRKAIRVVRERRGKQSRIRYRYYRERRSGYCSISKVV